jgi:nitrate/nitrite transport system substrate-binding protein
MVANMKVGKMDGFLRRRTLERPRHRRQHRFHLRHHAGHVERPPGEGVRLYRGVRRKKSATVKAVLKALHEASVWLDDLANRPEQCEIVARPTYINCDQGDASSAACSANSTTATVAK